MPAITGVRAGADGALWVQRMGPIEAVDPMAVNATDRSEWIGGDQWDVFDREWRWLGTITLPERIRITRIERDAIIGIARGEDDVEQVVVLRIARGPSGP